MSLSGSCCHINERVENVILPKRNSSTYNMCFHVNERVENAILPKRNSSTYDICQKMLAGAELWAAGPWREGN
jgi:hypothetical protein